MASEDYIVRVVLRPDLDKEALRSAFEETLSDIRVRISPEVEQEYVDSIMSEDDPERRAEILREILAEIRNGNRSGERSNAALEAAEQHLRNAEVAREAHGRNRRVVENKGLLGETSDVMPVPDEDEERGSRALETLNRNMGRAAGYLADGTKFLMTSSFELVEGIYNQMKQASPLLQAVESMFNLAVQLFFMPMGNKLGEILIPATVDLLEKVTDMWDAFEGQSLGEMVTTAITEGTKVFGEYLIDIGSTLSEEQGIVGSIGEMFVTLGTFIESNGAQTLSVVVKLADWVLNNLPAFIQWYVAMKGVEVGSQLFSSIPLVGSLIGGVVGGAMGFAISDIAMTTLGVPGYAEGGVVPATPGGRLVVVGEGGEDEIIVPKSKLGTMGGTVYITNNFSGYTREELIDEVNRIIDSQIARSRSTGGF